MVLCSRERQQYYTISALPGHVFPILQSGTARRSLLVQMYGEKTKVTKISKHVHGFVIRYKLWFYSPILLPEHKQEVNEGSNIVT